MSSSSSSRWAVYWKSKMSLKFSTSRSVTTKPISVGVNFPPIFVAYCRSWMVLKIVASVELHDRTGNAEPEDISTGLGVDVHRGLIEHRRIHLRCHKALPDQLVNL